MSAPGLPLGTVGVSVRLELLQTSEGILQRRGPHRSEGYGSPVVGFIVLTAEQRLRSFGAASLDARRGYCR